MMMMPQPPHACFAPTLPLFHDDGIRACVEPVGQQQSAAAKKKKQAKKQAEETPKREIIPACGHNSWDNVRVIKGHVTLRCRVCQVQWRTFVDSVWRRKKCGYFNTPEGCTLGERCSKIHLHSRKQSLAERIDQHGVSVLAQVPAEAIPKAVRSVAKPIETKIQSENPCNHNNWDNVRVKKGLVTLRCRTCQKQWRRPLENLPRCSEFPNCPNGESCDKLHLHAFKQSLAQRMGSHGSTILNKVPPCVWNGNPPDNGISVSCSGIPLNWPQVLAVEGIRGWYDSTAEHRNIPSVLIGGVLLQGPSVGVGSGLRFNVTFPKGSVVYVMHETSVEAYRKDEAWEVVTPSLARSHPEGESLLLPATEKAGELFSIIIKQPQRTVSPSSQSGVGSCSSSERFSTASDHEMTASYSIHGEEEEEEEDFEEDDYTSPPLSRCPSTPTLSWAEVRRPQRSSSCPPPSSR